VLVGLASAVLVAPPPESPTDGLAVPAEAFMRTRPTRRKSLQEHRIVTKLLPVDISPPEVHRILCARVVRRWLTGEQL
jgi:hypothetical protein